MLIQNILVVADKLHWTFKLYDKDGSGEIDPDEMEDIFKKLCKIAAGIEADQQKILMKEREREKMREEKLKEKELEEKDKELQDARLGIKKASFYSKRMNRVVGTKSAVSNVTERFKRKESRRKSESDVEAKKEMTEEEAEKKKVLETIIKELKDRDRDCNNFDPGI